MTAPDINAETPDNLRVDLVRLSEADLAEARQLGISPDALKTARAVERARDAARMGLAVDEVARWEQVIEDARRSGRGLTQADWATASGRDKHGRRQPA